MEGCVLCQVLAGEVEAFILYEDERTAAFLDRNPAVRGHTLVVPTAHEVHLFEAGGTTLTAVFQTVQRVSTAIAETLHPDGVSLFYTSADLVGNVTHAHVHLLPRYTDDGIRLSLARDSLEDHDAAALAGRIRQNVD